MKFSTVKELRQDTRRLLAEVDGGERFAIAKRGRPGAILSPAFPADDGRQPVKQSAEAGDQMESSFNRSDPAYATMEEALDHSRLRPSKYNACLEIRTDSDVQEPPIGADAELSEAHLHQE